jgi:hypothetical protein
MQLKSKSLSPRAAKAFYNTEIQLLLITKIENDEKEFRDEGINI